MHISRAYAGFARVGPTFFIVWPLGDARAIKRHAARGGTTRA